MRRPGHWQLRSAAGALAGALALGAFAALAPTMAAQASTGPVSTTPASGTPELAPTGTTEQIRQIVQCGNTMYAVGNFTSIKQGNTTYPRNNAFSFSATTYKVTSWDPSVNGTVNTIALTGDCSSAYIGGRFTQVHGTSVKNLAKISTSTGAVDTSFKDNASGQVETMLLTGGHLLTGGYFTSINGSGQSYYVSLNPSTGQDDKYLTLSISGHYTYPGVKPNPTRIYNQQLSPDGSKMLVEGDFTMVGGQPRQQVFMIDLGGSATLDSWNAPIFNDNCQVKEPFYVQDAAWAGNNAIYTVSTGLHLVGWNHTFPLTGPCDVVMEFPASNASVQPTWQNYTGCDSLFSVATDSSTVYIGGHERWADNPNGCNHAGSGAVSAQGMAGFSIASNSLLKNSSGTAGLYSRSRGLGADDMLVTSAGLWIASDNQKNVDLCQGVHGHAGLCFLPYSP